MSACPPPRSQAFRASPPLCLSRSDSRLFFLWPLCSLASSLASETPSCPNRPGRQFFCCGRSEFVCQAFSGVGQDFSPTASECCCAFCVRLEGVTYVASTRYGNSVRLGSLTYELRRPSQAGIEPLFFAPWRLCARPLLRAKTPRRKETVGKRVANGDSAYAAHPSCITGNPLCACFC